MSSNRNLIGAKVAKDDEYYTRIEDVESELSRYPGAFAGKRIYMPCDDRSSAFWRYFEQNVEELGWASITASRFHEGGHGEVVCISRDVGGSLSLSECRLSGDGDFLSDECLGLLDGCDVVATNLPFSRFREYVRAMMNRGKNFVVIGGKNGGKYQDTIGYVVDGRMRLGHNDGHGTMRFLRPDGTISSVGAYWFTTLPCEPRALALIREYAPDRYPRYANLDAIEVSKVSDVPADYDGLMGVPVTFLEYYDPDEWELLGTNATILKDAPQDPHIKAHSHLYRRHNLYIEQPDGSFKRIYDRLIIRRRP